MSKCLICLNTMKPAFEKFGYKINQCSACGLYQTELKKNYYRFAIDYYSKNYFTGVGTSSFYNCEADLAVDAKNFEEYLEEIKLLTKGKRLLDVGCATGNLMQVAKKHGFNPYGNDISAYAVSVAKRKFADKVRLGNFSRLRYKRRFFDVVMLTDVIEHVENPKRTLEKVREILKPGGLLAITTGDSKSPLARIMGKNWHFFVPPQHLWVFNQENLTRLLTDLGFQAVSSRYVGRFISLAHLAHLVQSTYSRLLPRAISNLIAKSFWGKLSLKVNFYGTVLLLARRRGNNK